MNLYTRKNNKFKIHWSKRNIFRWIEFQIYRFFDRRAHKFFLEDWNNWTSQQEDWCNK